MSAEQSKRWADHGDDSEDEEIIIPSHEVPIDTAAGTVSASGKIVLGSTGTRASARPKRDAFATRLVLGNLEPEISESQVSRFLGPGDYSVRVARGRGLAFVEVRGAKSLVDKFLALDGTRLGRKVVSVRLDLPKFPSSVKSSNKSTSTTPGASAWTVEPESSVQPNNTQTSTKTPTSERWAFVETEKTEKRERPPKAPRKTSESVPAAPAEEGEKKVVETHVVFVEEVVPAERKPLQLLPRTVAPKEIVVVAGTEDVKTSAPTVVEAAGGDKHTERLVRRKEAKAQEAQASAAAAKAASKTKNRFAGLMDSSEEEEEDDE